MEKTVYEKDGQLIYRLSGVDAAFAPALREQFYHEENGAFTKAFSLPVSHAEDFKRNFLRDIENVLRDEASPEPFRWEEALARCAAVARDANISWWTTGRAQAALMGADLPVHDLDMYFDVEDRDAVTDAFHDLIIEPVYPSKGTWRENSFEALSLLYAGCPVCLFFGVSETVDDPTPCHFGAYARDHLESFAWQGFDIRMPPLTLYIDTLTRWGKDEIANKLRQLE